MATDTVGSCRTNRRVLLDLSCVVMIVGIEIPEMTGGAFAAVAVVDGGIAIAVDPCDQNAVGTGMTVEARIVVHHTNDISRVTGNTKGSGSNSRRVIMTMRSSEIVNTVTLNTCRIRGNSNRPWPTGWILQTWRRSVAVAALIGVDSHRVIGRMTADTEPSIKDVTEAFRCSSMINVEMSGWRLLVQMTTQAVYCALIGVFDDHLHRSACWGGWIDVAVGVMALKAATGFMDSQDFSKGANRMAVGT